MMNTIATPLNSVYAAALFLILYPVAGQDPQTTGLSDRDMITNENAQLGSRDHRVILHPGRWKIRTPERHNIYLAYRFFLGFNWTELKVNHPECSQVACIGLSDNHQPCDHLCFSGTFRDATIALNTAKLEYNRAMASLDAAFNDLSALMDTHIMNQGEHAYDSVSKLLSYHGQVSASDPDLVDVMRYYRTLIEEALANIVEHLPSTFSDTPLNALHEKLVSRSNTRSTLHELLDTWKSGAFKLAVQLNGVTFAFQGAHQRLLSCAQGVMRSDMTGCEPDFMTAYYTDTPVASHSLASSRLVMIVKRESWTPVMLSHWYMPFIDSSNGNRTCWLDRPMVRDAQELNYRLPSCDSKGICDPLVRDDETLSACQVNENGEIGLGCPVVCDTQCFGPICYQATTDTYTLRTSSVGARDVNATNEPSPVLVTNSPRVLSNVFSLSEADIHTSLARVQIRSAQSSELLQRGETVLQNIMSMEANARKYIEKVHTETAARSQRGAWLECEGMLARTRAMGAVSVTLSALTCPLLIALIIKRRCISNNQAVSSRTLRSI